MKTPLLLSLTFAALAVVTFPATAATIRVPNEEPTIQAGIDAAAYGDTVLVECGTSYEHDIVMKSGVCLTSETGLADCVTIDAQQLGLVFFCEYVDGLASIVGFSITGGNAGYGGGMYCRGESSPTLTDCTFVGNQANNEGGGMYCSNSSPTLTDCTFEDNHVIMSGGGMYCHFLSSPTLTGCTFEDNHSAISGGGMSCDFLSSPTLTNCTFSGNHADNGVGMFCGAESSPTLTNCIIAFSTEGEAIRCNDPYSSPVLTCCNVYGNAGGDWVGCIADQYGVDGNLSEDPLFCGDLNPEEPYRLHASSPCASENSPECGLIGAWGVGCGLTAVEPVSWGAIKAMFQ